MSEKLIDWNFVCPKCSKTSNVQTNISKRQLGDKPTVKVINTAVSCSHCKEITLYENLNHLGVNFDWQTEKSLI